MILIENFGTVTFLSTIIPYRSVYTPGKTWKHGLKNFTSKPKRIGLRSHQWTHRINFYCPVLPLFASVQALLILLLGFILLFAFVFDAYRSLLGHAPFVGFLSFLFIGADAWDPLRAIAARSCRHLLRLRPPLENFCRNEWRAGVQFQKESALELSRKKIQWFAGLHYTLWVHQVKTLLLPVHLIGDLKDKESQDSAGAGLFKIESYVCLVADLRLESFHDDLVLAGKSADLVREVDRNTPTFLYSARDQPPIFMT